MKTSPNKIVTIYASFSDTRQDLAKDIEDISVKLYKGEQYIKDLPFHSLDSPVSWKASHIFPGDAIIGDDYKAVFEVKFKDQKDPIIEEQKIELVRDVNLVSHVEIKDIPLTVQSDQYEEVPEDIKAYLVNKQ